MRVAFWSALEEAKRQEQLSKENDDDDIDDDDEIKDRYGSTVGQERLEIDSASNDMRDGNVIHDDDDGDDFVDKYGQKITVQKSEAHVKEKVTSTITEENITIKQKTSDQNESLDVRMDTDDCDRVQNDKHCDHKKKVDYARTESVENSQEDNMACKGETESGTENDKQTTEHTCVSNITKGSDSVIRNSAKLYHGEELLDLFRSLHSGPKVQNEITTVGMVNWILI